jgi:hypothetical protein
MNTKFSFQSEYGCPMKGTKFPVHKFKNFEHPYHDEKILRHINSLQENSHKFKTQAKKDTSSAVSNNNDILYLILTRRALLGLSYKQYLEKFDNPEHVINTARIVKGPYDQVSKKATQAIIDSYNFNIHNMKVIDTKKIKPLGDIFLEMREKQRKEQLERINKKKDTKKTKVKETEKTKVKKPVKHIEL